MLCLKKILFVGFYAHSSVYSIYTYQKSLLTIFSKLLLFHLRDKVNNTEYIMMLQGPLLDTQCNGNKNANTLLPIL